MMQAPTISRPQAGLPGIVKCLVRLRLTTRESQVNFNEKGGVRAADAVYTDSLPHPHEMRASGRCALPFYYGEKPNTHGVRTYG